MSGEDKALRQQRRKTWQGKATAVARSWDSLLNRAAAPGADAQLHVCHMRHSFATCMGRHNAFRVLSAAIRAPALRHWLGNRRLECCLQRHIPLGTCWGWACPQACYNLVCRSGPTCTWIYHACHDGLASSTDASQV